MSEQKNQGQPEQEQGNGGTFENFRSTPNQQEGQQSENQETNPEQQQNTQKTENQQQGGDFKSQSLAAQTLGSNTGSGGIVGNK